MAPQDFIEADYILSMDEEVLKRILDEKPEDSQSKVELMMDYAPGSIGAREVPDPYYGRMSDFTLVLHYIEESCLGLLESIIANHLVDDANSDPDSNNTDANDPA